MKKIDCLIILIIALGAIKVIYYFVNKEKSKGNNKINYVTFYDGKEVYYNPVIDNKCLFGEEGCMKWYAFLDDSSKEYVNLILNRNLIDNAKYSSERDNKEGPIYANEILYNKTINWKIKPRLISAQEIAKITGYKDWNQNAYYFDSNNKFPSKQFIINNSYVSKYYWLFDNTNGCLKHGCKVEYSETDGYWTSTKYDYNDIGAWVIYGAGSLTTLYDVTYEGFGIRPVISVLKEKIK